MGLKAGELRDRISLQSQVTTLNSFGDQVKVWETFATVWANVYPLSAREFLQAQAQQSEVMGRVTIRYRSDVTASTRILHGSKIYNIAGILPDADSGLEYLTLPISIGLNDG